MLTTYSDENHVLVAIYFLYFIIKKMKLKNAFSEYFLRGRQKMWFEKKLIFYVGNMLGGPQAPCSA